MKFVICNCPLVFMIVVSCTKDVMSSRALLEAQFHKESCNCPGVGRDRVMDNTLHLLSSSVKFAFRNLACDMYNSKVNSSLTLAPKGPFISWPRPHVSLVSEWADDRDIIRPDTHHLFRNASLNFSKAQMLMPLLKMTEMIR